MQAGQPGVLGSLIHTTGALGLPINFLQRHQIRARPSNHPGDPFQIQPTIETFSVMDVVGQHSERTPLS